MLGKSTAAVKRVDYGGASWSHDLIPGYYPLLISLYKHLEIPLVPTYFDFSFSHLRPSPFLNSSNSKRTSASRFQTYFIHSGASGRSIPSLPSSSLNSPLASLYCLTHLLSTALCFLILIVLSFLSWHRLFPSVLGHTSTLSSLRSSTTLLPFFQDFIDNILVPVFSSVGTMTSLDVLHTPLPALLDYIHAGMGTSHYTLGAGFSAGSIAEMLVAPLKEQGEGYVRLKTTITTMKWECDGSVGVVEIGFEESEAVEVDKVVIATQASAARVLLSKLSTSLEPKEKERVSGMIHALAEVDYRVSQKPTTS
jgi:hypothetical protein